MCEDMWRWELAEALFLGPPVVSAKGSKAAGCGGGRGRRCGGLKRKRYGRFLRESGRVNGPMTARSAGPPEVSGHTLKPDQTGRLCAFLQPWSAAWAQAWSRLSIGAPQG